MRGNLPALSRLMAVLCDDLAYSGASVPEREAAIVMGALHTAIVLERTGELAALVEGWAACHPYGTGCEKENAQAAVMKLVERQRGSDK